MHSAIPRRTQIPNTGPRMYTSVLRRVACWFLSICLRSCNALSCISKSSTDGPALVQSYCGQNLLESNFCSSLLRNNSFTCGFLVHVYHGLAYWQRIRIPSLAIKTDFSIEIFISSCLCQNVSVVALEANDCSIIWWNGCTSIRDYWRSLLADFLISIFYSEDMRSFKRNLSTLNQYMCGTYHSNI